MNGILNYAQRAIKNKALRVGFLLVAISVIFTACGKPETPVEKAMESIQQGEIVNALRYTNVDDAIEIVQDAVDFSVGGIQSYEIDRIEKHGDYATAYVTVTFGMGEEAKRLPLPLVKIEDDWVVDLTKLD